MRSALPALVLVFLVGGCAAGSSAPDGGTPDLGVAPGPDVEPAARPDPQLAAAIAAVDEKRIAETIRTLSSLPTRHTCSDPSPNGAGIGAARELLRSRLAEIAGMHVRLDPFPIDECGTGATRDNVVAWLEGAGHPERLIVVGGHYDSRTVDLLDANAPAPGANDSGSQSALVLEAARVLAGAPHDATILFVAFAGEEQGLVGSGSFVKNLAMPSGATHIEAMLNCDIVGGDRIANDAAALAQFRLYSPGTPREIRGRDGTPDDTSPSRGLMRFVATVASLYVPEMTLLPRLREDRPGRGGDHESFIAAALPGVRFIETNEELAHEHTGDDLFDYVTPSYTARIARIVAAAAAHLASAPRPPTLVAVDGTTAQLTARFTPPEIAFDHFVLAARPVTENFYRRRLHVGGGDRSATVTADDLAVADATAFFVSIAAVDSAGHESLFAYPEYRCDATACTVPADALDVTATR